MRRRHRMSRRHSKRLFSRTASRSHKRNYAVGPMRGGIRL